MVKKRKNYSQVNLLHLKLIAMSLNVSRFYPGKTCAHAARQHDNFISRKTEDQREPGWSSDLGGGGVR